MKWIFTSYGFPPGNELKPLAPSLCHPLYARERERYMLERHGVSPVERTEIESNHIDLGGSLMHGEPTIDLWLGPDRSISCWAHQASWVLTELQVAGSVIFGGREYKRLSRWPGVIVYISARDCRRFVARLKRRIDMPGEEARRVAMLEALVRANVRGRKDIEPEVRRILQAPEPPSA